MYSIISIINNLLFLPKSLFSFSLHFLLFSQRFKLIRGYISRWQKRSQRTIYCWLSVWTELPPFCLSLTKNSQKQPTCIHQLQMYTRLSLLQNIHWTLHIGASQVLPLRVFFFPEFTHNIPWKFLPKTQLFITDKCIMLMRYIVCPVI